MVGYAQQRVCIALHVLNANASWDPPFLLSCFLAGSQHATLIGRM